MKWDDVILTALLVLATFLTIRTVLTIVKLRSFYAAGFPFRVNRDVHVLFFGTAVAVGCSISAVVQR